jgi:hypothetical protein
MLSSSLRCYQIQILFLSHYVVLLKSDLDAQQTHVDGNLLKIRPMLDAALSVTKVIAISVIY